MPEAPIDHGRARDQLLTAIGAISGSSLAELAVTFREAERSMTDQGPAAAADVRAFVGRLKTRLGLAPAVDTNRAIALGSGLDELARAAERALNRGELAALDRLLHETTESVPTPERDPVVLPPLPEHQIAMWRTVLGFEQLDRPWVLVGGQMTMLHCLENGHRVMRATDDGDVLVGVWTRRDALRTASRFLRDSGFVEMKTSDNYGYRFTREGPNATVIDLLVPDGLERQRSYPTTSSGRPGFPVQGGNQALARAERVPLVFEDVTGYVRRPSLLGAIVAKAHAFVVDSRDTDRHAEDIVTLAEIALRDPRATLQQARPDDRRPVRRFLRDKDAQHRLFRQTDDPPAVFALLKRLADPDPQVP